MSRPPLFTKFDLKVILIIIVLLAAAFGISWLIDHKIIPGLPSPVGQPEIVKTKIYSNSRYNFELRYPSDWIVDESGLEDFEPQVSFYKNGHNAGSPHTNATQVVVFPKGLGTEGPAGESRQIQDDLTIHNERTIVEYFLNQSGKPWGYYISFFDQPQSWESFGFVWASVKIDNDQSSVCADETKTKEQCDPFMDGYLIRGSVSDDEMKAVKEVLASLKFK